MKSKATDYLELVTAIYTDSCGRCTADVFDLRDIETLISRTKYEGMSFLTITLPQFASDIEKSLEAGCIDPTYFSSFKKYGCNPAFLRGFTGQIFDQKTGRIYNDNSVEISVILEGIRQICLSFKKIEIECSPKRSARAIQSFIDLEASLSTFSFSEEDVSRFSAVSSVLWSALLYGSFHSDKLIPRHGPGTTAEGIQGNLKYSWQSWHARLEPYFSIVGLAYPLGLPSDSRELDMLTIVPEDSEPPVRVVFVPKTLKSPRVIAIEPCCMQYTQQAIRSLLTEKIDNGAVTGGQINFSDQSVNQQLALTGSRTGLLATIDLSDASDRVPHALAMEMFRSDPDLRDAIEACRSKSAILPNGAFLPRLAKFASMGSALCFVVEAMYFYTICVMAVLQHRNLPVNHRNVKLVSNDIHVYGDDIIVPSTYAVTVLATLQKYNCKVNNRKTFVTGKFRESCGVDAYDGYPVTPVYIRQERPSNRRQANQLISWVATANLFQKKGYWRTTDLMFRYIESIIGTIPVLPERSAGLGRNSLDGFETISSLASRSTTRWNRKLQRFEIRALVPKPIYHTDILEGYGALMKCLLELERPKVFPPLEENFRLDVEKSFDFPPPTDVRHLGRSVRRGAVALKRRWLPAQ